MNISDRPKPSRSWLRRWPDVCSWAAVALLDGAPSFQILKSATGGAYPAQGYIYSTLVGAVLLLPVGYTRRVPALLVGNACVVVEMLVLLALR